VERSEWVVTPSCSYGDPSDGFLRWLRRWFERGGRLLANGKWSMGPAAVGLMMQGPWVYGVLVSQQWSFAGWGHKDVNQMVLASRCSFSYRAANNLPA
jgi:hypothetical protein